MNEPYSEKNDVLTGIKTTLTTIGLVANFATLLALTLNNEEFPQNGRILLLHQTVVDTIVCLMGIGIYGQKFMWLTGNATFDLILCQAWHGQALYWGTVFVSVWNKVLIAIERFIVINKVNNRKTYRVITGKVVITIFATVYMISFILMLPAYFWVKYESTNNPPKCSDEKHYFEGKAFENFMKFYGVLWFFIFYAIPIACLIALYRKMNSILRKEQQGLRELIGSSNSMTITLDKANRQITRTAVAVTIAFVISLSWEAFYCCIMGFSDAITYEFNKPLQVVGVFLATLHSCSTPFIYAATMPIFRKSLRKTLKCGKSTRPFISRLTVKYGNKDAKISSQDVSNANNILNPSKFFETTNGTNKNVSNNKTLTGSSQ